MKIVQACIFLFLSTFPVLAFGNQGMVWRVGGPYDTQALVDFVEGIHGKTLNLDPCSSAPLNSGFLKEDSCNFGLIWTNPESGFSYYAIVGKPGYGIVSTGWSQMQSPEASKTKLSLERTTVPEVERDVSAVTTGLDSGDIGFTKNLPRDRKESGLDSKLEVRGHDEELPYEDQIVLLIETGKTGRVLDSRFYLFYDPTDFGKRGIKPMYSNFGDLGTYIKSVKAYSQTMDFLDAIKLIEDSGMRLKKRTESEIVFIPPPNPYDVESTIDSANETIEGRSGILFNPNWPDYARVLELPNGSLVFEMSKTGGDGTWVRIE